MESFSLPEPPSFDEDVISRCKVGGDYAPMFFEWYKYVAMVSHVYSSLLPESPSIKRVSPLHFAVLIGFLNRCARLMVSNLRLGAEGRYGETTALLGRCILETAIKTMWLCKTTCADRFERLVADGLKGDLELKERILAEIAKRDGAVLEIERRMLDSITRYITLAGMTEHEINTFRPLPDLASLMAATGYGRISYVVVQKMGSHYVHGTWSDLLANYLEVDAAGRFHLRDSNVRTHENFYALGSLLVLDALKAFVEFISDGPEPRTVLLQPLVEVQEAILLLQNEASHGDFEPI
jgi:uncharacterized protein DUF5677